MNESDDMAQFHESACIDDGALVGEGTRVWHYSHIMAGARIGRSCNIGQNVVVSPGCMIGDNVKIQNNVSIYTGVTLEDDVFCGPSCVFTNVINPRAYIQRKNEFQKTLVKQGASIGANATIICGHTLGSYCLVAAGAVVTKDVPDYGLIIGNPGRLCGYVCYCGETLFRINESQVLQDVSRSSQLSSNTKSESQCQACHRCFQFKGNRLIPVNLQLDK